MATPWNYGVGPGDPEVLQQIEVGAAFIINGDQFSIDDRSFRQIRECLHDIRKLSIQRFSSPREQSNASSRLDREGSITVKFDLPDPLSAFRQLRYRQTLHWLDE